MKKLSKAVLATSLLTLSLSAFADMAMVTVTGDPIMLTKNGTVYSTTNTLTPGPHAFMIDGTKKVCYIGDHQKLTIQGTKMSVNVAGAVQEIDCYDANPQYFTFAP